jgi:CheY-like chemotaxis protein
VKKCRWPAEKSILSSKYNPRVKIIVATGSLEPGLRSELFRNEARDYIRKPYSVENILEKLEGALEIGSVPSV